MQAKNKEKTFEKSEVMSLLENMSDGISLLAEGQQDLKKDMDTLKENVSVLKEDMTLVKEELFGINHKLDRKIDFEDQKKLEKRVFKLEKLEKKFA